ncbi:MAG TPA: hypothetical protein VD978_07780 [Azospirillum sp.]|nr:hypothetical protein [Azospirillum sp.]
MADVETGLCADLTADGDCTAQAEVVTADGMRLCRECALYYAGEWPGEATAARVRRWAEEAAGREYVAEQDEVEVRPYWKDEYDEARAEAEADDRLDRGVRIWED